MVTATFLCSLLFILAGVFFSSQIASAFGADESLLDLSGTYLKVLCCFAPFFMLNDVMICFIRNDGDPNLGMAAMVVGSLANILLDYIFIFSFGLGLFGAALATGVAPVIGICLTLIHWTKPSHTLKFELGHSEFSAKQTLTSLRSSLALGFPSFVMELATGIVILAFNLLMLKEAGNTGVAAYGVIANISYVVIAIYTGIAQGVQPLMSRALARGIWLLCERICIMLSGLLPGFLFFFMESFFLFRRDHTDIQQ